MPKSAESRESDRSVASLHVAIIMDGNGRWAKRRGLPRLAGHAAGATAVRRTVEAAPSSGIATLTLYAFSSDNWRRPQNEVTGLFRLFEHYLRTETARCVENDVRLVVIGRRDRLPERILRAIATAEETTRSGRRLLLRVAIDYSSRDLLLTALARHDRQDPVTRETLEAHLAAAMHAPLPAPPVDLLIRTGGEQRLSDFLLWECAYAELLFLPAMWPEFGADELASAVADFRRRDRRFGTVAPRKDLQRAGRA